MNTLPVVSFTSIASAYSQTGSLPKRTVRDWTVSQLAIADAIAEALKGESYVTIQSVFSK
jgi:hypothetical protein